jgi:hypothetical protein
MLVKCKQIKTDFTKKATDVFYFDRKIFFLAYKSFEI